jgi:glyoxylase-like metal-dependent hydrolase (beta-lactamase superfamily II)
MSARVQRNAAEGIHLVEDAYVNWYLVEDGGRLTVVDSGHPASWKSLHAVLREIGRSPGDIDAVVLTHAHFDHMGFAERARSELGVPVFAHERELALARHPWRYDHERSRLPYFARHPSFVKRFTAMGAAGALWVKGTEHAQPYGDAQTLDVPGRPQVVFTPGHTHGHCSLHFPDRGAIIAGDAIVTLNPYTGGRGPQIVAGAATADSGQALASLDALGAIDAATVLTGHGPVWRDGAAAAADRAREAGAS